MSRFFKTLTTVALDFEAEATKNSEYSAKDSGHLPEISEVSHNCKIKRQCCMSNALTDLRLSLGKRLSI